MRINLSKILITIFFFSLFIWIYQVKIPFSSPDEVSHLVRANTISHGYFIPKEINNSGDLGGAIDENLIKASESYNAYVNTYSEKGRAQITNIMKEMYYTEKSYLIGLPTTTSYIPIIYTPQATSFFISERLHLNFYDTYQLVNIITFSFCLFILMVAYKCYPIPLFTLVVIVLPMSLYQIFSPTIDGLSLAVTVMAMSLFMRLLESEDSKNYTFILTWLSFFIILAIGSKANLIFMLALPAWLYIVNRKKENLTFLILTTTISLIWTYYAITHSRESSSARHPGFSNADLIIYYLKNINELIYIIYNTLINKEILSFYLTSFIGNLASLNAPVSVTSRIIFCTVLLVSLVISLLFFRKTKNNLSALVIALLSLISTALIFAALLIQWNSFPTTYIEGVQGRYFIIPLAILGYAMPTKKINKYYLWIPILTIAAYSCYSIEKALSDRFSNEIHIPQDIKTGSSPKIFNVKDNETFETTIQAPNGSLESINILIANYNNSAKGQLNLQVCSGEQCEISSIEVDHYSDNSFYRFSLKPLLVISKNDILLNMSFQSKESSSPIAIWLFNNSNDGVKPTPKIELKYNKTE